MAPSAYSDGERIYVQPMISVEPGPLRMSDSNTHVKLSDTDPNTELDPTRG